MFTGLMLVFLTAIVWGGIGAVISNAAQKNLNIAFIQLFACTSVAIFTLPVIFFFPVSVNIITVVALLLAGVANFGVTILINRAMYYGPNGITWAICQSAFIMPFLMGVIFFDVPCPAERAVGAGLLLLSMPFMGMGKEKGESNIKRKGMWIIFCLLAYLAVGISQCGGNLPSYFVKDTVVNIPDLLFRSGLSTAGNAVTAFIFLLSTHKFKPELKKNLKPALLLTYCNIMSTMFVFWALDLLAMHGAGAIGYPAITGLSIILFIVYTAIKLRERPGMAECAGVLICLTGIVLMAV